MSPKKNLLSIQRNKKSDLHKLRGQYKTTQRSASCHTQKVFMEQQSSGLTLLYSSHPLKTIAKI